MKYVFIIVGVGGTGSLLARDLPKLMIGSSNKMVIIDGDIVEDKNRKRQAYQKHDVGCNKAIALSAKINSFYGCICEAIDMYVTKNEIKVCLEKYRGYIPVIIGCVDNDKTRILLENTFNNIDTCIYLDSANSEYEGNVYSCVKNGGVKKGPLRSETYELDKDVHPINKSCQEQAAEGNTQFIVTNMKMANVLFEHIYNLLIKKMKVGVTCVGRFKTVHYE